MTTFNESDEIDFTKYKYTKLWFPESSIRKGIFNYIGDDERKSKMELLEIGCYEGLSSVFFAHYFLDHPESSMTCVDPFLTLSENDHKNFLQNGEEANFDYNISICKNKEKVKVKKVTSDFFFASKSHTTKYNFIYIDGSHIPENVSRDVKNSFEALKVNGIMWMDDYLGGSEQLEIKKAIDNALEPFIANGVCEIIYSNYQHAVRRLK